MVLRTEQWTERGIPFSPFQGRRDMKVEVKLSLLLGVGELHSPPTKTVVCRAPACNCPFQLSHSQSTFSSLLGHWDQQELHCLASRDLLPENLWEPLHPTILSHCPSLEARPGLPPAGGLGPQGTKVLTFLSKQCRL